jgi:hypothetical protein
MKTLLTTTLVAIILAIYAPTLLALCAFLSVFSYGHIKKDYESTNRF